MTRGERYAFGALILFVCLAALLWLTEAEPVSVFSACRADHVTAVVKMVGGSPSIVDAPTGTPLAWDTTRGFDWPPGTTGRGWLIAVYPDGGVLYAWLVGDRDSNLYALVTDDLSEYVAPYGGVPAWHVRCGGWVLQ